MERHSLQAALAAAALAPWLGPPLAAQASQHALRFHGTGLGQQDRLSIAVDDDAAGPDASAPCDVGAGSFTIELWVRGTLADNPAPGAGGDVELASAAWESGNTLVDRSIAGGSEAEWGISLAGGRVRFGTGRGDGPIQDQEHTLEGSAVVLDGTWHHVACVRALPSGTKAIYVDGLLDFQSAAGASTADLSYPDDGAPGALTPWGPDLVVGAAKHDLGPQFPSFAGRVDELRLWKRARTAAEILEHGDRVVAPASADLVGCWRLEEGAGTIAADSSAASSPAGVLAAGVAGNGEWTSVSIDVLDVAPVSTGMLPWGFERTLVAPDLVEPTALETLPDGRILIAERSGRIRVWKAGGLLAQPLIQLAADVSTAERGLACLARDPDFTSNGYLYAYFTTDAPRNRVARYTVVGDVADPASERIVWENPDPALAFHHGGGLAFGPDGNLYIATGDQYFSAFSQLLTQQHGKLLRLTPLGDVPADNPFAAQPGPQAAVYAYGLRNPFRLAFDAPTGTLWIGDVGGNGADSWEEIDRAQSGANYGWPIQEGPVCFGADCAAITFPTFAYRHDEGLAAGAAASAAVMCGPVYRAAAFPPAYQGNLLFGDYARRSIRRLVLDAAGSPIGAATFLQPPHASSIVDLEVDVDGSLLYVAHESLQVSPTARLWRVSYVGAPALAPVAVASAAPDAGPAPLAVQFSSAGSFDPVPGPSALAYAWDFGDGGSASVADPAYVYATAGNFAATLTVSDGAAQASAQPIPIQVGNAPVTAITAPPVGLVYEAGQTIHCSGTAVDLEDGPLPPSAFTWRVLLFHDDHVHPFLGPIQGTTSLDFQVPTSGHSPEHTHYIVYLKTVDSDGLESADEVTILPREAPLSLDTTPSGIPVMIDGQFEQTPLELESLVGFQHDLQAQASFAVSGQALDFACWSDGGAASHVVAMPLGGMSLTAAYGPAPYAGDCEQADCGFASYDLAAGPANVLGLVGFGTPTPGVFVELRTTGMALSPGAWTALSVGAGSLPLFGGVLLVDAPGVLQVFFGPATGGRASLQLALPGDPTAVGVSAYFQSLALEPAQPAGFAFSAGLSLEICP